MSETPKSFQKFGAVKTGQAPTPPPSQEQTRAVVGFSKPSAAALTAFTEQADAKQAIDLFPVVEIAASGHWDVSKYVPADIAQLLPSGKKPFGAVVLGYRYELTAWPSKQEAPGESSKVKPVWSAAIPSDNGELMTLATKFCKNYQFTAGIHKGKYDESASGVGHCKPVLAVLAYLPEQNMVVELRTRASYNGAERTGKGLMEHVTPEGALEPFPCEIDVETNVETAKEFSWKVHHILFKGITNDRKAAMGVSFQAWAKAAGADEETVQKYNSWVAAADRPLTADIADRIRKGASL